MVILTLLVLTSLTFSSDSKLESALSRAEGNRSELEQALQQLEGDELEGLVYLIQNMPTGDLKRLSADFLTEHVSFAYRAWSEAPWSSATPQRLFLENVLPYASINERRDAWFRDFYERFKPLVAEAKTPSEAAAILNQQVFPLVQVIYSTKRPKADQSPYESMDAGMASCTGLSVLLIDACRSVGVPARFVGVPSWADDSGNHSWVEIWDDGWRFTGAAEPTGDELDRAWFTGRAAKARADSEKYGIFAVSFTKTPQRFPMVWQPDADEVYAVNVTERYTTSRDVVPEGSARVHFRVLTMAQGELQRCAAMLRVTDARGDVLIDSTTKDERFDANDHVGAVIPIGAELTVEVSYGETTVTEKVTVQSDDQTVTIEVLTALSRQAADQMKAELWQAHLAKARGESAAAMEARVLTHGQVEMPFWYEVYGDAPAEGHSLWISMHGGGGAPAEVNDQQWENQKRLYQIEEGVYVAPRAPTNTWNLWHEPHIDALFDQLIQNMIVVEGVNPNRVYLLGYSAGGDGVYQLAPRMADRFAGAAMMAGHPNDARAEGLRNLAFTLHMGGDDSAYDRNKVAAKWKTELARLKEDDPTGYTHLVEIHEGKGHWMDREDAAALPWMAAHTRTLRPERVVWRQSSRTHNRFYWLAVDQPVAHSQVTVVRSGQEFEIIEVTGVEQLTIRLDDTMVDLDQSIVVKQDGVVLFEGLVQRSRAVIESTLQERGDLDGIWCAEVSVTLRKN